MFTFAELAHMVDATQLRSRGHMLDASAVMGCLGWGGVGMFTFAELAHLVAATQLRSRGHMLGCFGSDGMFGVGWGGDVHVRRTCTPGGCYATAFPWTHAGCFGIDGMFGVGWGGDVHVRRTCTHGGCCATRLLSYVHSFQFRFNNKKLWKSTGAACKARWKCCQTQHPVAEACFWNVTDLRQINVTLRFPM